MSVQSRISWLISRLPLAAILLTASTSAQMIPLEDLRTSGGHAFYQDVNVHISHRPPVPFAYWEDQNFIVAEKYEPCENPPPDSCLVGYCSVFSYQISEFFPAGIQFSGSTQREWGGPPGGPHLALSNAEFKFRVDTAFDYSLFAIVDPGDWPIVEPGQYSGGVQLMSTALGPVTPIHLLMDGTLQVSGRLGPGTYTLNGWSGGQAGVSEFLQGATYSAQWLVTSPQQTLVTSQPPDLSVACGGTAVFSIGVSGPPSNYTFQWRRNLVPLSNGPSVLGATSSTLTLTSICMAGVYDCVVTGGAISEPTRLATLAIVSSPTGVEIEPADPVAPVVAKAPVPNPFRTSTSIGYDVRRPTRLVATVYNASGARVRSIADRIVSGSGSITWDGRVRGGARAPVGIYFLRVEMDDVRESRKVVLLE